jgi:hypothetical protein
MVRKETLNGKNSRKESRGGTKESLERKGRHEEGLENDIKQNLMEEKHEVILVHKNRLMPQMLSLKANVSILFW